MDGLTWWILAAVRVLAADLFLTQAGGEEFLAACFPHSAEVSPLERSDSLRVYAGRDLYRLINGGADIFLEYGFSRAGALHYQNPEGGQLSVEIYEMTDTEAAYGIFSCLAAGTGRSSTTGQEGVEGEGFVIFWKNRFVVSVTALDEGAPSSVTPLVGAIDKKIAVGGRRPLLVEALLQPVFQNAEVIFLKGSLAFDRRAGLGRGNLFRFEEGSSGLFQGCTTFILRYPTVAGRDSALRRGCDELSRDKAFTAVSADSAGTVLTNGQGEHMHICGTDRYLLVVLGPEQEKVVSTASRLRRAVEVLFLR